MKQWPPVRYPDVNGKHVNADPSNSIKGSWPDGLGYQQIIDEICNAITGNGIALDGTLNTQLAAAIATRAAQATASVTLYVRTDGNDSTGDGSANMPGKAFRTNLRAIQYGLSRYVFGGYALNIQLGIPGAYDIPGAIASSVAVNILGDPANPQNYILSGSGPSSGGSICFGSTQGPVSLNGGKLVNTGNTNHTCGTSGSGTLSLQNVQLGLGVSTTAYAAIVGGGGAVTIGSGCSHINSVAYGAMMTGNINLASTFALTGGPPFCSTAFYVGDGLVTFGVSGSPTITGTANGARYLVINNAVCKTGPAGGANFFPGSAAGSTDGHGLYS